MFETRTRSKLYVLLGRDGPKPMGKGRLRIKAGDFALRRVEDNVQRFAVGLTLHAGQGQIEIKMLLLQMAQLMLKRLLALLRGEAGVYIDIEAAVIVRDADALDGAGQGDQADIVFEHGKLILTPLMLR